MVTEQETKAGIRKEILCRRTALKPEEKARMDEAVLRQLMAFLEKEQKAGNAVFVYCYVSFGGEVDTRRLLSSLWKRQIPVAVPRVEGRELHFYWIHQMEDLRPGFHEIPEPVPGCKEAKEPSAMVLVPGTAFTEAGGRLGYGGGFYDRFFLREPEHRRIGLAYEFQMKKELPLEAHDMRMDAVATDQRILRVGRREQEWN